MEINGIVLGWKTHNKVISGTCINITETASFCKDAKKTLETRRFLESMDDGTNEPTLILEDNQAAIAQ